MANGTVDALLIGVANFLADLALKIANWVAGLLQTAVNSLATLAQSVLGTISQAFQGIGAFLLDIASRLQALFESILLRIENAFNAVWNQIVQASINVLSTIASFVERLYAEVKAFAGSIIDSVVSWIDRAAKSILEIGQGVLDAIVRFIKEITVKVGQFLAEVFDDTDKALAAQVTVVGDAVQRILGGAESLISTIGERLVSLRDALAESIETLLSGIKEELSEEFKPIVDSVKALVDSFLGSASPAELQESVTIMDQFTKGPITPELLRSFWGEGWSRFVPSTGLGSKAFFALMALGGTLAFVVNAASIQASVLQQDLALSYPWIRAHPADAAVGWRRGAIDRDKARELVQRHGFDHQSAELMLDNTAALPTDTDLLASWLRGDLTEEGLDQAFFQRGYSPGHAGNLKRLARVIPPVQDLITMAVREVFTPEIAQRFGQFEDFPEAFKAWAEKHGLSEEWARNYWAAHWRLPSAEQGFEMLHRGVVGEGDLDILLRSLDVMPFWREGLKRIAFNPFTRVDIRRMHQLGILDEAAVHRAHLDIGYDEEKARALTEFTIRLNKRRPAEDDEELGRLSRASVIGFYTDGILSKEKAFELLVGMGHTADAALLYLQSADLDKQRSERKAEAEHVVDLAAAGTISFAQAQDRLNGLGLSRLEVESALLALVRAQERLTKLPTRAEGERMFEQGIISEPDYRDLLARLGYAPKWIAAYVKLAEEA